MEAIMKVSPKRQVRLESEKPPLDAVAIFRKTTKGKLKLHPHEAYEEEMEERIH